MDEKLDSETKSMSDDETAAPPVPIWLRETYAAENPELELTDREVSMHEKEDAPFDISLATSDWYIWIDSTDGTRMVYEKKEIKTSLRANILAGKHDKNSSAIIFKKRPPLILITKDNRPLEKKWKQEVTTLAEFGKKNFDVGSLYQPIWSYAKAGLKWGAAIGIILKSFDTSIGIFRIDPFLAILVTICILVCFIPRYGQVILFSIYFTQFQRMHNAGYLLPLILSVALVGAGLGCLPGMTIGGLIGWGRRRFIPRAQDAVPEPKSVLGKAVLLPFLGGCAVIAAYLYVSFNFLLPLLYRLNETAAMQG